MTDWYKKCPYCWENIRNDAVKCRYCHEFLDKNENIKSSDLESEFWNKTKINLYFSIQPFCPHCNSRLEERTYECPYCNKSISLVKYHLIEDNYSLYYEYDEKKKTVKEPYVYCSTCNYLWYAKKKTHRRFRDWWWWRVELAFWRIRLEHVKWFICPNCQSDSLLVNSIEQIKLNLMR